MDEESRRLAQGIELFDRERFDLAIEPLADVLRLNPENPDAIARLAFCYTQAERRSEAVELCKDARRCAPEDDYIAYLNAGTALICGEFELCEECIEHALRVSPSNASYYTMKANLALHQSRWREAFEVAGKALNLDPEDVDAMRVRTVAARGLGDLSSEVEQQRITDRTAPADPAVRAEAGWINLQQGKLDQAEADFREAMKSDPDWPYYQNGLSETLRANNPVGMLLRRINWASRRRPYVPVLVSFLGSVAVFLFCMWGIPGGIPLAVGTLMYVMPTVLFTGYGPMVSCIGLTKQELRQLVPAREVAKGVLLWIAIASVIVLGLVSAAQGSSGSAACFVSAALVLPPLSLLLGCSVKATPFRTRFSAGILLILATLNLALIASATPDGVPYGINPLTGYVLQLLAAAGPIILASLSIKITMKPKVGTEQ